MRHTLLSALALAALLSIVVPGERSTAPASADHAASLRLAAVICGNNGCAPVQTKAQQKRKFQTLGHG